MKKKIVKKAFILIPLILLAISVLVFIVHLGLTTHFKKKGIQEDKNFELIKNTRYLADCMEFVNVLEAKDIVVDEDYKQLLTNKALEMIKSYKHTKIFSMTVGELLYISENCNSEKNNELVELLDTYYVEDKMLFSDLPYKNYNPEIVESQENIWVLNTIEIANRLYNYDEILSKYKVMEGLAKWYNNNSSENNNEDELEMIFWLFYKRDMLDMIDYSGIEKIMEQDRTYEKEIIDDDNLEASTTAILYADGVSDYQQLFHNDESYVGFVDTLFSEITTLDQLEYQKDDKDGLYFLSEVTKCIERPNDNAFFVSVINSCLKESYNYVFMEE